jgi:arginine decarboxylase
MGLSDHARILVTISIADDDATAERLLQALKRLTEAEGELPDPRPVLIRNPLELELETVDRPRDAFFCQV